MARLRHANGAVVVVPDEKVDALVRNGFTAEKPKKSAPRKASSDESDEK